MQETAQIMQSLVQAINRRGELWIEVPDNNTYARRRLYAFVDELLWYAERPGTFTVQRSCQSAEGKRTKIVPSDDIRELLRRLRDLHPIIGGRRARSEVRSRLARAALVAWDRIQTEEHRCSDHVHYKVTVA